MTVSSISAVRWKDATRVSPGYLQFTLPGSSGLRLAADENTVYFQIKESAEFEAARAAIEEAISSSDALGPISGADEVVKLAALYEAGHLTEAEFTAAKAKALGI